MLVGDTAKRLMSQIDHSNCRPPLTGGGYAKIKVVVNAEERLTIQCPITHIAALPLAKSAEPGAAHLKARKWA